MTAGLREVEGFIQTQRVARLATVDERGRPAVLQSRHVQFDPADERNAVRR